jgi:hypothetical protein
MNNKSLTLVLLLCLACMALGMAFGKYAFACQHAAAHVFQARECFSLTVEARPFTARLPAQGDAMTRIHRSPWLLMAGAYLCLAVIFVLGRMQ